MADRSAHNPDESTPMEGLSLEAAEVAETAQPSESLQSILPPPAAPIGQMSNLRQSVPSEEERRPLLASEEETSSSEVQISTYTAGQSSTPEGDAEHEITDSGYERMILSASEDETSLSEIQFPRHVTGQSSTSEDYPEHQIALNGDGRRPLSRSEGKSSSSGVQLPAHLASQPSTSQADLKRMAEEEDASVESYLKWMDAAKMKRKLDSHPRACTSSDLENFPDENPSASEILMSVDDEVLDDKKDEKMDEEEDKTKDEKKDEKKD